MSLEYWWVALPIPYLNTNTCIEYAVIQREIKNRTEDYKKYIILT